MVLAHEMFMGWCRCKQQAVRCTHAAWFRNPFALKTSIAGSNMLNWRLVSCGSA